MPLTLKLDFQNSLVCSGRNLAPVCVFSKEDCLEAPKAMRVRAFVGAAVCSLVHRTIGICISMLETERKTFLV